MGISNITGPPVEGENFFGRERELASAWNHIKKGNSIILSAPRRVGKSSFAKKLIAIAAAEEWRTLEIDLEEIGSEQKFLEIFVEKLRNASWWNKTASTASDIINHILENTKITIKETATIEWKAKRADLFTRLGKLLNHEDETLIMIDEVTVLLNRFINIDKENGRENVSFFLYWLRNLRQVSETKIRWIFCSSIGIDNFTSRHNLSSTFNDVFSFPIGPFDELTTKALLRKLADSDQFLIPDDLIEQIVSRIGWCLPYFIQVIYFHFHNLSINRKETNSVENIDEAFRELIESKELNTWDERLTDYAEYEHYARDVLKLAALNNEGINKATCKAKLHTKIIDIEKLEYVTNKLLYMLINDGYLVQLPKGKIAFRSPILRAFWVSRFV